MMGDYHKKDLPARLSKNNDDICQQDSDEQSGSLCQQAGETLDDKK